jgi:SAM-dependent methyltransferase
MRSESFTVDLFDLVRRTPVPAPWAEGEKIPWNDPEFSERMLREHVSQAHDGASRRSSVIDAHVDWVHHVLLHERAGTVLDLGCGPGLYTTRLAERGHRCTGIDFSPASIAHAREVTRQTGVCCDYHLADIRSADYGDEYDLVMLLYGEFNVFRPADARLILNRACQALKVGGLILLEVHTDAAVRAMGAMRNVWRTAEHGLFSAQPHVRLDEHFWDAEQRVATTRYVIVDAATAEVSVFAESVQAYTIGSYRALLTNAGFVLDRAQGSLDGTEEADDLFVLVGTRI